MRAITYDVPLSSRSPREGEYLVTIGKRGIGSAYLILGVREIRPLRPRPSRRLRLVVCREEVTPFIRRHAEWWMRWHPRSRRRTPLTGPFLVPLRPSHKPLWPPEASASRG
jgi:hypothetical protein